MSDIIFEIKVAYNVQGFAVGGAALYVAPGDRSPIEKLKYK